MHRLGSIWRIGDRTVRRFAADQGLTWAGAVALYLFLSIPPLMMVITWAGGLVAPRAEATAFAVAQVAKFVPSSEGLLRGIVAQAPDSTGAALVSIAILLVSGTRIFAALTSALNVIWRRIDDLVFWRRQVLRAGMLGIAGALVGISAATEWVLTTASAAIGVDGFTQWIADWQLLPATILVLALWATYLYLPQTAVDRRTALGVAIGAAVAIRAAQWLTGVAIAGAIDPSRAYGALGEVALLLTWGLVIAVIILLGAELLVVIEERHGRHIDADGRSEERFTSDDGGTAEDQPARR